MSTISKLIFHNAKHFMSSPYGYRNSIATSAGNTGTFHTGVDYGTYGVKLPQYAIEDGVVMSCGTDWNYGGAKFVWVKYPRINKKMLHYHLDSICVEAGQSVDKNTILGYTGATGRATGIHLHLEIHDLDTGRLDPEKYSKQYKAPKTSKKNTATKKSASSFLPSRGYFTEGDVSPNIGKIAKFMRKTFPSYTSKKALGNTYGPNLIAAVKEFQKRTGLEVDGNFGPLTLVELRKYGFKK